MPRHPPSSTLPGLIRAHAQTTGDAEAVICGERRLSYRELHHDAARAAHGLARLGVGPGDKVAILMGNRAEWIIAAIATGALGATVVAMNTWWTPREIAYAMNHSSTGLLICDARYMRHDYARDIEMLRDAGELQHLRAVVGVGTGLPATWLPWQDLCDVAGELTLPERASAQDVAYVLYTSGSTSAPKGVQLRHGDLIENTWQIGERMGLGPDDRLWLAVSLFWGFGCSNAMPAVLSHGGCLVLQESFEAAQALDIIERERCTVMYGTPNMIQAMSEHPQRAHHDISSLRTGATLGTPEQLRRAAGLAPQICNVYGLTEIYGNCHATDASDPLALRLTSCGRPVDGVMQRIVDPESGQILEPGEVGEIRVKGRVTPGYLNDSEQTAAAFDQDGFFRTGDLGRIDAAGNLQFQGRLKELVKTGGINVSPAEIESVLMSHPGVGFAVVTGVPDATRDEVLGAVVIPRAGHAPTPDELRSHCKAQLAIYKVPSLIHFCTEDALPLTTTGKVQKNRLAEMFFGAPA